MLPINSQAPDFTLKDQDNKSHKLSDYRRQWVLIYFYPKDNTPGCTIEACSFRDNLNELKKYQVQVIGISADSVNSHKKFHQKQNLNFPLLSDPEKSVIKKYQAWGVKKFIGKTFEGVLRISYLIDPQGIIKKTYPKVNPLNHAKEVINDLKNLKNNE